MSVFPRANDVLSSLRLRVAYFAGGEVNGRPVICIPAASRPVILSIDTAELKKLFTFLVWAGCNGVTQKRQIRYYVVASLRDAEWSCMRTYMFKLQSALPPDVETLFLLTPHQKVSLTKLSYKAQFPEFAFKVIPLGMKALQSHVHGSQLTEEFGGTLEYSHSDWVDLFLRYEKSRDDITKDVQSVKDVQQLVTSTKIARLSADSVQTSRRSLQDQVQSIEGIARNSSSQLQSLLRSLGELPCQYRLCHTTPFFRGLVACLRKYLDSIDAELDNLGESWEGKSAELLVAVEAIKYRCSLTKCLDGLKGHHGKVHGSCGDVGDSFSAACTLLARHQKDIEDAQVELVAMRRLLDQEVSMLLLDNQSQSEMILQTCNAMRTTGDKLAHDLARRELQLEKAKLLHSLLHEAEHLCDIGYRLLATQALESCLTEDGSLEAIGDVCSSLSQVSDISFGKMASIAREMPVDSSLARNTNKTLSRRNDLVVLLKTRSDSLAKLLLNHNLAVEKVKTTHLEVCSVNSLSSRSPEHHADSGNGESTAHSAVSTADEFSPTHARDPNWDADNASVVSAPMVSSISEKWPKRSTSAGLIMSLPHQPLRTRGWTAPAGLGGEPHAGVESPTSYSIESPDELLLQDEEDDPSILEKRRCIAQELLTTERIYIDGIRDTIDTYWTAMDTTNRHLPPFLAGKQSIAFSNLPRILEFHEHSFLLQLEQCTENPLMLGRCFVNNQRQFQMYIAYCKNKHRSDTLFEEYEGSFFEALRIKRGHRLSLRDYLIKPVQRITKYQLLLKEMLKNCSNAPSAQRCLQTALDSMLEILQQANDVMHSSGILGYPGSLLEQGHVLMQDSFQIIPNTSVKKVLQRTAAERERQVFFYEQVLIFTKKQPQRLGEHRTFYTYKDHIRMAEVALTENMSSDSCRFVIAQHRGTKSFILQAKSLEMKKTWVTRIRQSLEEQLRTMKSKEQQGEVGVAWTAEDYHRSSVDGLFSNKYASLPLSRTPQDLQRYDQLDAYTITKRTTQRESSPSPTRHARDASRSRSASPHRFIDRNSGSPPRRLTEHRLLNLPLHPPSSNARLSPVVSPVLSPDQPVRTVLERAPVTSPKRNPTALPKRQHSLRIYRPNSAGESTMRPFLREFKSLKRALTGSTPALHALPNAPPNAPVNLRGSPPRSCKERGQRTLSLYSPTLDDELREEPPQCTVDSEFHPLPLVARRGSVHQSWNEGLNHAGNVRFNLIEPTPTPFKKKKLFSDGRGGRRSSDSSMPMPPLELVARRKSAEAPQPPDVYRPYTEHAL